MKQNIIHLPAQSVSRKSPLVLLILIALASAFLGFYLINRILPQP